MGFVLSNDVAKFIAEMSKKLPLRQAAWPHATAWRKQWTRDDWGPLRPFWLGGGTMSKKFSQLNRHEIPTYGGHLWNRWKSAIETGGDAGGRGVGLLDPAAGGERVLLLRLKRWEGINEP
jgi:hypothetical protein